MVNIRQQGANDRHSERGRVERRQPKMWRDPGPRRDPYHHVRACHHVCHPPRSVCAIPHPPVVCQRRVAARLEQQAVATRPRAGGQAQAIALSIDGGHVRSVRSYQVRSFEVMLAQLSTDDGKQVVFSSMPAEADRQRDQLRSVLHELGATPATPVTMLSDGADGPRSLGESASVGATRHVLDWFHLAMRIEHVAQAAKS